MKLVYDAHNFMKWWSTRASIIATSFASMLAAYVAMPVKVQDAIPQFVVAIIAIGTIVSPLVSMLLRPVQQSNLPSSPPK